MANLFANASLSFYLATAGYEHEALCAECEYRQAAVACAYIGFACPDMSMKRYARNANIGKPRLLALTSGLLAGYEHEALCAECE